MKSMLLIDEDSNDAHTAGYQPQNNDFTGLNWTNLEVNPVQGQFLENGLHEEIIASKIPENFPTTSHFLQPQSLEHHLQTGVFCLQCDVPIDTSTSVIGMESAHLRLCAMRKELHCETCGAQFNKTTNLRVHILLEHQASEPIDGKYACQICNRGFTRLKALRSHVEKHMVADDLQCARCRSCFTFQAELNRHLRWSPCSTSYQENQLIFCPHCSATIAFSEMDSHVRQHSILRRLSKKPPPPLMLPESFVKDRPHQCNICEKRFKRPAELKRHLNKHSGEKSFVCELCQRAYTHERGLLAHVQRDHNMKRYGCPFCGAPFKSVQSMQRHAKAVHPLGQNVNRADAYNCDICHCSFGNVGALSVHLKHQHDMILPEHMRKVYVCPFCEKTFRKNRDCIDHIHSHTLEKRLRCKRCGKKFSSRNGLKVHMEIHLRQDIADPTLAMHRCGDCFKLLSSADALRRHRAIHQIYQCCRCGVKLPSAVRLRHHESACNIECDGMTGSLLQLGETASQSFVASFRPTTSRPASVGGMPSANFEKPVTCRPVPKPRSVRYAKPHICWLCHKVFTSVQQLQRHRQVHERERPMNCVVCQRSFRNRNRWLEHMAEAHPDVRTAEMPHEQRPAASSVQPYQHPASQQPTRAQSADMFYQNQQNDFYNLLPSSSGNHLFSFTDQLDFGQTDLIHQSQALPENNMNRMPAAPPMIPEAMPFSHEFGHHDYATLPTNTNARVPSSSLRCPVCQHLYQSIEHLLQHLDQIAQESMHAFSIFTCPLCTKSVSGCAAFAEHLGQIHRVSLPGPSGFIEVPKTLVVAANNNDALPAEPNIRRLPVKTVTINRHTNAKRSEDSMRIHKCTFCGKEFLRKSDIQRHIRSHTGEKPFSCSICGRSFANNYNLKVHEKTHERDGEKNHTCTICEKSFFHMSALKLHMRKHTGDKPLKCPVDDCSEMFMSSSARLRHIEWHNNGCPRSLKLSATSQPPTFAMPVESKQASEVSEQQQLNRTIQQISRLKKQPLKVHTTSAFMVPTQPIAVPDPSDHDQVLCVNLTPHEANRYRIELSKTHVDPPHGTTHFCLPSTSLRVAADPMIYNTDNVTICISTRNALQALHENTSFPQTISCDVSPSSDLTASGRIVWVIAAGSVTAPTAQRINWRRECAVCDLTFTREKESEQHFTSEDHETAELTSCTRRGVIGMGPSLSAGVSNQEPQQAFNVAHRGDLSCQWCGMRLVDMELLIAHIHRFHNSETRGLETVRPAARTAPIH